MCYNKSCWARNTHHCVPGSVGRYVRQSVHVCTGNMNTDMFVSVSGTAASRSDDVSDKGVAYIQWCYRQHCRLLESGEGGAEFVDGCVGDGLPHGLVELRARVRRHLVQRARHRARGEASSARPPICFIVNISVSSRTEQTTEWGYVTVID